MYTVLVYHHHNDNDDANDVSLQSTAFFFVSADTLFEHFSLKIYIIIFILLN